MAKRHHHMKRRDHSPAHAVPHSDHTRMEMKRHEEYAGHEESAHMMARDAGMIREDWSQPCLLPAGVHDRQWPRAGGYRHYQAPDLFSAAQSQLHEDERDFEREFKPTKQ